MEKAIREQLKEAADAIYQLRDRANDPKHTWTAEDEAAWNKANADYEALKARADKVAAADKIKADLAGRKDKTPPPGRDDYNGKGKSRRGRRADAKERPTEQDRATALQAWMRVQKRRKLRPEHVEACRKTGVNPYKDYFDFRLTPTSEYRSQRSRMIASAARRHPEAVSEEQRAQSVNLEVTGAAMIPEGFVYNLEIALLAYANVRQYAEVIRTDSGQDLPWPTVNDTTTKGSILAENATVSEADVSFAQVVFHAYKYTSGMVQVPVELLEDSAFNLATLLADLFGIRFGRIEADHMTTGTGVGQPAGLVTAATSGVTAASSTAIAADEIYDLKHSVDPAYRPGASYMMHDLIKKYVKKLKDGTGRYLWQASLAGGAPDTIDNDPVAVNQSMASSVATGNTTMLYGLLSKYKVRDVAQVRMRRLIERYADSDQEGFVAFKRLDANLIDAGTHPVKYLKQP